MTVAENKQDSEELEPDSEVVSLYDLSPAVKSFDNIVFDFGDSIDDEVAKQIGINVRKLQILMRIAGVSEVGIQKKEDDDSEMPVIVGVDERGQATGANLKGKRKRVDASVDNGNIFRFKCITWQALNGKIPSIKESVLRKNGGVNELENWRSEIESSLKKVLLKGGSKSLMIPTIVDTSVLAFVVAGPRDVETLILRLVIANLAYQALMLISSDDVRNSPFKICGMEIDRLIWFWIEMSRVRLVEVLEGEDDEFIE